MSSGTCPLDGCGRVFINTTAAVVISHITNTASHTREAMENSPGWDEMVRELNISYCASTCNYIGIVHGSASQGRMHLTHRRTCAALHVRTFEKELVGDSWILTGASQDEPRSDLPANVAAVHEEVYMAPEAFDAAPVAAHTRSRVLARDGAEIARIESAFVALASYLRTTPLTARDENTISELISHIADKRACAQAPAPAAHNAAPHESTAHSLLRSALSHYLETRSISSFFARLSSAGVANLLDPETRNEAKQCFNVATRAAIEQTINNGSTFSEATLWEQAAARHTADIETAVTESLGEMAAVPTETTETEVSAAIAGLKFGKAAGPDGINSSAFILLATRPTVRAALVVIINAYMQNSLPGAFETVKTIVLKKSPAGLRCISMSSCIQKLASLILFRRHRAWIKASAPFNFANGTRGGAEATARAARVLCLNPATITIRADIVKAFDSIHVPAVIRSLAGCPDLIHAAQALYARPAEAQFTAPNGAVIEGLRLLDGVRQGDALSMAFYAAGHETAMVAARTIPSTIAYNQADDTFINDSSTLAIAALYAFAGALKPLNLQLHPSKTVARAHSEEQAAEIMEALTSQRPENWEGDNLAITIQIGGGFLASGVPVGTRDYEKHGCKRIAEDVCATIDQLELCRDASVVAGRKLLPVHDAFELVRVGVLGKYMHVMRALPASSCLEGAEMIDARVDSFLRKLTGAAPDASMTPAQRNAWSRLYIRIDKGLGLYKLAATADAAYVGAAALTAAPILHAMRSRGSLDKPPARADLNNTTIYVLTAEHNFVHNRLAIQLGREVMGALNLDRVDIKIETCAYPLGARPKMQRAVSALLKMEAITVATKGAADLPATEAVAKARALSISNMRAFAARCANKANRMSDRSFVLALRMALGIPIMAEGQSCPDCHQQLDADGLHAFSCPKSCGKVSIAHDMVRDAIADTLAAHATSKGGFDVEVTTEDILRLDPPYLHQQAAMVMASSAEAAAGEVEVEDADSDDSSAVAGVGAGAGAAAAPVAALQRRSRQRHGRAVAPKRRHARAATAEISADVRILRHIASPMQNATEARANTVTIDVTISKPTCADSMTLGAATICGIAAKQGELRKDDHYLRFFPADRANVNPFAVESFGHITARGHGVLAAMARTAVGVSEHEAKSSVAYKKCTSDLLAAISVALWKGNAFVLETAIQRWIPKGTELHNCASLCYSSLAAANNNIAILALPLAPAEVLGQA